MKNIIKTIRSSSIIIILSISFSVFAYGQSDDHLKRAISAMETGLFEESLKQLNYALNDDPKNAQVHKLRALLFEALGKKEKAIRAVSYTHLRAHETGRNLVCRLLLEKKEKAIKAWNDCIRYSKDQNMIKEARIHLNYLNGI